MTQRSRRALSADEQQLLARFRQLTRTQQHLVRGMVAMLGDEPLPLDVDRLIRRSMARAESVGVNPPRTLRT